MSDNFEYDAAISAGDNSAADGGVNDFMVASIISNIWNIDPLYVKDCADSWKGHHTLLHTTYNNA